MRNNLSLYAVFLSILAIPFYAVRFSIAGFPTNLWEIFVAFSFFIWVWEKFIFNKPVPDPSTHKIRFSSSQKTILAGIFLIFIGLFSSALLGQDFFRGMGIIKGWFLFPLILATMVFFHARSRKNRVLFLAAYYFSAFFVGLIGLAYWAQGMLTFDGRLSAFYLSPNHLAMYLAPSVFIGWYWMALKSKAEKVIPLPNYPVIVLSLTVIFFPLYLTYSYASWAAIGAASALMAYFLSAKKSSAIAIGLFVLLSLAALFSFQADKSKFQDLANIDERSSLASRLMIWKSSVMIIRNNPVWGIGPGNFQVSYLDYQKHFPPYLEWAVPQPHNLYLAFWLQSGLLGLASFVTLISTWLVAISGRIKRVSWQERVELSVLLGIVLYVLFHGLVDTPYWKNDLAAVFCLVITLGFSYLNNPKTLSGNKKTPEK